MAATVEFKGDTMIESMDKILLLIAASEKSCVAASAARLDHLHKMPTSRRMIDPFPMTWLRHNPGKLLRQARLQVVVMVLVGIDTMCLADQPPIAATEVVPCDRQEILFAPYVWQRFGAGDAARAEATMPGAYVRSTFSGTKSIGLMIDGTANRGCPASSLPVIEYSVDEGPFLALPLLENDFVYTLPLADGLDVSAEHPIEVYFRAADLTQDRWTASTAHLRLAGFRIDKGASLRPSSLRPRRAICYGDSITEGVGVDGFFNSWQSLQVNNARTTWFPLVAASLDCEFGQLGSGGHGVSRTFELPPLNLTWDRFDSRTSRLTDGRLLPEPDYIFCALGTNDFDCDITTDYTAWLTSMRAACPNARFFCVVPSLGVHQAEIAAAVTARHQAGDLKVHLIDTNSVKPKFRTDQTATQLAHDGVHPSNYGQAVLGTLIAAEVRKYVDKEGK
jgi:lysophospholipase L1-like esterase